MNPVVTNPDHTDAIAALLPRLREIRHDIHQHPELGFEEHRTQAAVVEWLEALGYQPRPCAGTGVIAELHAEPKAGRRIALRADLDCLPMTETTDLPYRSVHDGRAHKCGHDGHTAIMLGVAALLAKHREQIAGNVRLLFQPAEEGVRGGGAKVMVAQGALDGVDEVYGLHNWPPFPLGHVRVCPGPLMAQTRELDITITGKGGHGSQPEVCRDPIVAGAHLVTALQSVVSRGVGSDGGAVLSICRFSSGDTHNVIPDRATLEGTMRSFDAALTDRMVERVRAIAQGTAAAFGVEIDVELSEGYPVLVNDPACAEAVARVAERLVGPERASTEGLPIAGAEDFAYLTQATAGAYFFLGAGVPGADTPGCHHPDFDFDDRLIPLGIEMFMGLVKERATPSV